MKMPILAILGGADAKTKKIRQIAMRARCCTIINESDMISICPFNVTEVQLNERLKISVLQNAHLRDFKLREYVIYINH